MTLFETTCKHFPAISFKMAGVTPLDHNQSLKEALIDSLNAILSPDHGTRISGEEQVKALEVTEGIAAELDTKFFHLM